VGADRLVDLHLAILWPSHPDPLEQERRAADQLVGRLDARLDDRRGAVDVNRFVVIWDESVARAPRVVRVCVISLWSSTI